MPEAFPPDVLAALRGFLRPTAPPSRPAFPRVFPAELAGRIAACWTEVHGRRAIPGTRGTGVQ